MGWFGICFQVPGSHVLVVFLDSIKEGEFSFLGWSGPVSCDWLVLAFLQVFFPIWDRDM